MFNTGAVVSALARVLSQQPTQDTPAQQPPAPAPPPPQPNRPPFPQNQPPIQTAPWRWSAPPNEPTPSWFHGFADQPTANSFAGNPYFQHNIYSEGDHDIGTVMMALQHELLNRSHPAQSPDPDIFGLANDLGVDWRVAQRYRNNKNTT